MQTESFLKSLGSSAIWRSLEKLTALAKHIIIAATIGLSTQLDIFYMVMALLGVLIFSWGGVFDIVAIPNMVKASLENRIAEFREIASGIFALTFLISAFLAVLLLIFRDFLGYIAIGFDSEKKQLISDVIPWLLPAILLYIPSCQLSAILRSVRSFSPFYKTEFIVALTILVCVLLFHEHDNILFWSYSLGVICGFLFLLSRAWHLVFPLHYPFSADILQLLKLIPGFLILQIFLYIYVLTDRAFVSFLPEGSISALSYAMTLVSLGPALIFFSGSFITVIAENKRIDDRSERLNNLISMVIFLSLGTTCFMFIAGESIVNVLLERGAFTTQDTQRVTAGIVAYTSGILPLFLAGPLGQVFQVEHRISLMTYRVILGVIINIILNSWFLFGLNWGIFGVALATSISYWAMSVASLVGVRRLGYSIHWRSHIRWSLWLLLSQAAAYICFILLPFQVAIGLPVIVISALLIIFFLLLAGVYYRGEESVLVRKTIWRLTTAFRS